MLLSPKDFELFARLYNSLMHFVNHHLEVVPGFSDPETFPGLSIEERIGLRAELVKNIGLIDDFVAANPANLDAEELAIVSSWKHHVSGKFVMFRQLKKHMIFLSTSDLVTAYGVVALTETFGHIFGSSSLPQLVEAILLPFKGVIIYDGLIGPYGVSFGGGMKRSFNDGYRDAKERLGIVASLPIDASSRRPKKARKPKPAKPKQKASSSDETEQAVRSIVELTDTFCNDFLNDEYAELCRKLAEKLSRKHPSPLLRGRPNTWACGIIRTIGVVNFLQDSSFAPYMKTTDIDEGFGVGSSTGQNKSKQIRDLLKIREMDPEWTLPSLMEHNPMVWMLEVDGLMMDARTAPHEIQRMAFERGLIPYIPAESET